MSWRGRKAIHCLRPQASCVSFARSKLPMCPWTACACLLQKAFLSEKDLATATLILHKKSSLGTTCRPGCHQHPPGGEGVWAGPPVSSVCAPSGWSCSYMCSLETTPPPQPQSRKRAGGKLSFGFARMSWPKSPASKCKPSKFYPFTAPSV